jgi:DNA-binding PadR family transcriptional regulator
MTNTEIAILSLIVEAPRHGYEIEQIIEARGMRDWTEIGFSSIYYILKKLEEKGLVKSALEKTPGRGPARKIYRPTEQGQREWHTAALIALSQPASRTSPFLMGLAALPAFNPEEVEGALTNYLAALEKEISRLKNRMAAQEPIPPFVEAMFSYSLSQIKAEQDWVSNYLSEVTHGQS